MTAKRPTIAQIKNHSCDFCGTHSDIPEGSRGYRLDFYFFNHEQLDAAERDCQEGKRPCARHACYELTEG